MHTQNFLSTKYSCLLFNTFISVNISVKYPKFNLVLVMGIWYPYISVNPSVCARYGLLATSELLRNVINNIGVLMEISVLISGMLY